MIQKILIVDDDEGVLEMVQLVLEDQGYQVQTSPDGTPLRQLQDELPDLILLDILLAGEDGRELCRLVKSRAQTRHIPVVLFSAHISAERVSTVYGADGFLSKPFHIQDLLNAVARGMATRLPDLADR